MAEVSQGAPRGNAAWRGPFLIDAHVHYYDCFDPSAFFDGALKNFRAASPNLGTNPELAGCLMFSESAGDHFFRRCSGAADTASHGRWTFRRTGETASLLAVRDGETAILLFAGRQIVTKENLEILALACSREFPDGGALDPTLDAVIESGAIPVLPWGFGKWWFGRGQVMARAVSALDPAKGYLGDNAGRPAWSPAPKLFAKARARNILILPGSDPLPFASEAATAGSYGFVLAGEVNAERPAEGLKSLLRAQRTQPDIFGRLESPVRFCRHQIMMQVRKRMGP